MDKRRSLRGTIGLIIIHGALTTWERIRELRLPLAVREQLAALRARGAEIAPIGHQRPLFLVTLGGRQGLLYGAALYGFDLYGRLPRYEDIESGCVAIVDGQPLYWARDRGGWCVVHGNEEDRRRWDRVTIRGPVDGRPLAFASRADRCQPYIGTRPLGAVLPQVPFGQRLRANGIDFDIADRETGETTTVYVPLAS